MAYLKIYSPIVNEENKAMTLFFSGVEGVSFQDIDEFISSIPENDNLIDMRLHCAGGDVIEGWAMVDKLRATGKEICATIEGQCASMATVLLCAAPKEARRAYPHAQILIHDPYIPEYTLADAYRAEDLEKIAADLRANTEKILDFYVERTGANREELAALMKDDKWIDTAEAQRLGFISEIIPPASAYAGKGAAAWPNNNQNKTSMKNEKTMQAAMKRLAALMGFNVTPAQIVAYELDTESGETITIDKPEGEAPAVGDNASPDGEHKMPDGTTIIIEDGIITEIRAAEEQGGEGPEPVAEGEDEKDVRIAELEAENAELKERIAELEQELEGAKSVAKTSDEKRILNLVKVAGGIDWLKKVQSEYKPAGRGFPQSGKTETEGESKVARRLAELRAKK
ncbi:ATP-dependent Clp protease proteolytic subunit [Alistipes ihumii]|uniref:ATP-dependent Clp protease proteolytic subunit n=1 Tax=Alistipes ihumii TaxID=1470347 RepID=UPI0039F54FFB